MLTQILAAQGNQFHFSFGDYVTKALLGSVDSYFDSLDTGSFNRGSSGGDGCCTVA